MEFIAIFVVVAAAPSGSSPHVFSSPPPPSSVHFLHHIMTKLESAILFSDSIVWPYSLKTCSYVRIIPNVPMLRIDPQRRQSPYLSPFILLLCVHAEDWNGHISLVEIGLSLSAAAQAFYYLCPPTTPLIMTRHKKVD